MKTTLKELKKGDFFTKKSIVYPNDNQVWIKGDWIVSMRKYACTRFSDHCDIQYITPSKEVFTDLIF